MIQTLNFAAGSNILIDWSIRWIVVKKGGKFKEVDVKL